MLTMAGTPLHHFCDDPFISPGSTRAMSSPSSTSPSVSTREDSSPAPSRGNLTASNVPVLRLAAGRREHIRAGRPSSCRVKAARSGIGCEPLGQAAGQRQHSRPYHMDERDEARDGVAGQPDQRRAIDDAHRHGPARLDRHPPQHQRADARDRRLDVILLAGRDATGGEDQIVRARDLLQAIGKRAALAEQDAEIDDLAAEPAQHRHQHEAVGTRTAARRRAARPAKPARRRSRTPRRGCA